MNSWKNGLIAGPEGERYWIRRSGPGEPVTWSLVREHRGVVSVHRTRLDAHRAGVAAANRPVSKT
jgi:hypothetical protein